MNKGEFLNRNSFKNWRYFVHQTLILFKLKNVWQKTTIVIILMFSVSLCFESCKTCKCPAYSQIESQIPVNTSNSSI